MGLFVGRSKPVSRTERGFTLIELMIVVTIVGVLAVIGLVAYSKFKKTAGLAEATNMIAVIKAAQEAYKGEKGGYCDVSADLTSFYPAAPVQDKKTAWGGACGAACKAGKSWSDLGVQSDGPVMYGYATVAGNSTTSPSTRSSSTSLTTDRGALDFDTYYSASKKPWYIVHAKADHGDSITTRVMSSSWANQIVIEGLK